MAAASEDLRLSLSLCSSQNCFPLKLTLFPSSAAPSKARCINGETEEDAGAWSPVSTLSSLSGKRSERDDNEGDEDGQNSPKKLRLSKEQTTILEESFKEHNTLNPKQKQALAKQLNLRPRQVEVWFQNRRARTKLKQTEVECEYLKRWCQKLAEENKRLQKEVGDLRALKSAPPQLQMNASPPTTLTMCPSCESITTSPSSFTAAASSSLTLQLPPHHRRQQGVVPAGADPNPWASYFFTRAS